jgi:hypothetical protein
MQATDDANYRLHTNGHTNPFRMRFEGSASSSHLLPWRAAGALSEIRLRVDDARGLPDRQIDDICHSNAFDET